MNCHLWTPAEDDLLRTVYLAGGIHAATAALPGRTLPALYHRARRLGLDRRRRWSTSDDRKLRDAWDEATPLHLIAKTLGRTRLTVYNRAQRIGLPLGVPDGWEYLSTAADRCGYTAGQLRPILRWAKVPIRAALSSPYSRDRHVGSRRLRHVVETFEVDVALEAWHATEPCETAARRLGLCGETLARRLARIGIVRPGKKRHLRVTLAQVRAALAPIPHGYSRIEAKAEAVSV